MSLVFRNALMPSENQQALRLRPVYFMRRLRLIIQLLGLSALLLGSVIGSFILMTIVSYILLMGSGSPGGRTFQFLVFSLLIFFGFLGLILLYWRFIVFEVFKHVRKSLRQKTNLLIRK